jgi:hypothetical protein
MLAKGAVLHPRPHSLPFPPSHAALAAPTVPRLCPFADAETHTCECRLSTGSADIRSRRAAEGMMMEGMEFGSFERMRTRWPETARWVIATGEVSSSSANRIAHRENKAGLKSEGAEHFWACPHRYLRARGRRAPLTHRPRPAPPRARDRPARVRRRGAPAATARPRQQPGGALPADNTVNLHQSRA